MSRTWHVSIFSGVIVAFVFMLLLGPPALAQTPPENTEGESDDKQALPAPGNFGVTNWGCTTIKLSWDPVFLATQYGVTFSGRTRTTSSTSYTAIGLSRNTSYSFSVRARSADSGWGDSSGTSGRTTCLSLGSVSNKSGEVGKSFSTTLSLATGGMSPRTYSISGHPPGLSLSPQGPWRRDADHGWGATTSIAWVPFGVGVRTVFIAARGPYGRLQELRCAGWRENTQQGTLSDRAGASLRGSSVVRWVGRSPTVPSGREWNGSQPGQGAAELGFPRPAIRKMQGQPACRAGEPSGQGEEPPPEGLGGGYPLSQTDPRRSSGPGCGPSSGRPARRRWRRSGPRGDGSARRRT